MSLPPVPPLKSDRLDFLEAMVEECTANSSMSSVAMAMHTPDESTEHFLMVGDIASMVQELRRRRRKMGYKFE